MKSGTNSCLEEAKMSKKHMKSDIRTDEEAKTGVEVPAFDEEGNSQDLQLEVFTFSMEIKNSDQIC